VPFPIIFTGTVAELKFTGFPIMVNLLTGEETSHFELGIGVVPGTFSLDFLEGSGVLGTATIGYRAQPRDGGFVFRIGLTPLFTLKGSQITGGLSLGFAF
jgi:hypothetical protein